MSIAQARASMIRSHYIFVALLLSVVAAIAFGTLATQADAGQTRVYSKAVDALSVGDNFDASNNTADPILSGGSVDLNVQADLVPEGATEAGILTTSAGSLGSEDGPETIFIAWTNPADEPVGLAELVTFESEYFPGEHVGDARIEAVNLTGGLAGSTNGYLSVTSHAGPLAITVTFDAPDGMSAGIDRIGVSDCSDCRYKGADINVTVKDAVGTAVSGVKVELTLNSLRHGRFTGTGNDDSVTMTTPIPDAVGDLGEDEVLGTATFTTDTEGAFKASDTPGTVTFSGTVLGDSFEKELLVTGAPAKIVLSTSRVDRSLADLTSVDDLGEDLFSVGLVASKFVLDTEGNGDTDDSDTIGNDVFIVYVKIFDADGNAVHASIVTPPVVKDVTADVTNEISFITSTGDADANAIAVAGFGAALGDGEVEPDAVSGKAAVGVANGLGDAKTGADAADADLGSHDSAGHLEKRRHRSDVQHRQRGCRR